MAAIWTINNLRRSLAQMSQTWVGRLHRPQAAAASLSMSRQNSVEDTASLANGSYDHSRHPSIDQSPVGSCQIECSLCSY